ncbi:MAG: DUF5924 family protein [Polyangiaceae bacterium]
MSENDGELPNPLERTGSNDKTIRDLEPFPKRPERRAPEPDAPTVDVATRRPLVSDAQAGHVEERSAWARVKEGLRVFVHRHERKIWWLHTAYALSLGLFVASFAQKGFERARFLTVTLLLVWALVVLFFRFFGTGAQQDFITAFPGARRRFFVMTYLMKNLFQGMLFFLLPLYWRSGSADAKTIGIAYLLGACAILSTLDLVFDRLLLRFKLVTSLFFTMTMFGSMNVSIPALIPSVATLTALLISAGLASAVFFLFHVPVRWLRRPRVAALFGATILLGIVLAFVGRHAFPAVPMYIRSGGVGPAITHEGTVDFEVRALRVAALEHLYAVTDVAVVEGADEKLVHVWRKGGVELAQESLGDVAKPKVPETTRVASSLDVSKLKSEGDPQSWCGRYTVDVETKSGQVVGRVAFDVLP